ncbi:MAG TPA: hypothetical protein VF088_10655 [Pyrinomonadaceae bacterium]
MKSLLFACCLILAVTISTKADVAKPKTSPKPAKSVLHTSLEIVPDGKLYEAKLQISESDFQTLRAALNDAPGAGPVRGAIAFSAPRTIIAGLLMFLAVSVAGVLFARSSSFGRTQKALGAVLFVAVVLGAAAMITRGNAGPPGSWRWRNLPQALADGKSTIGGLDIEVVPDDQMSGRPMRLIIPLKKGNNPGEE